MHNFDQAYYQRYYEDEATQAVSPQEQQRLAAFIAAYLRYLDVPVHSILDVGCGIGQILQALHQEFPDAEICGVETSEYLCACYGWQPGEVQHYSGDAHALVICNDVLGYLDKKDARKAIRNLARLTETALYLSVLTDEDMDICDTTHTDLNQKVRPIAWYRAHLEKYFVAVGGGLFLKKPLAYPVWQMERA